MELSRAQVHHFVSLVPVECIALVALVRMNVLRDSIQFKAAQHAFLAHWARFAPQGQHFQGRA